MADWFKSGWTSSARPTSARAWAANWRAFCIIAARLHLSDRTLQRRLLAEASSFAQLLDATRCELARQYLSDAHRSLGEVADLLGFADQSNLFRACRRWFGMPPGQYRAQLPANGPSSHHPG